MFQLAPIVLSIVLLSACVGSGSDKPSEPIELTVSAAASLTDALEEIRSAFEADNPDIELNFNYGGSGALQRQIEQGAPVDLFLSASAKYMQILADDRKIDSAHLTDLLSNALVVVVPLNSKTDINAPADLTDAKIGRIAIGIPESVPAGGYAKEALTNASIWDALQPMLVQAKDVRQVLQYVESGNADAGFVYLTDARASKAVRVAFAVDPASYSPVVYPVGIVQDSKHKAETIRLYAYLRSKAAKDIFEKYGFTIANPEGEPQ